MHYVCCRATQSPQSPCQKERGRPTAETCCTETSFLIKLESYSGNIVPQEYITSNQASFFAKKNYAKLQHDALDVRK